jgi:hypothetical protein
MNTGEPSLAQLTKFFCHPLQVAAVLNGMSICEFKKIYQKHGIKRWPYNKYKSKNTLKTLNGFQDFFLVEKNLQNKKDQNKKQSCSKCEQRSPPQGEENQNDPGFEKFFSNSDQESEITESFERNCPESPLFNPVIL